MKDILLVLTKTKPHQLERIKQLAVDYDVLTVDEIDENDGERVKIIYGWNRSEEVLAFIRTCVNVSWVQATSAGVDYLPENIKNNADVFVTNVSGIHAIPISETVFAYILGTYRNLFYSAKVQANNVWDVPDPNSFHSLTGKTMLIFGAGNIGEEIARIAKAFRMHTMGVNTSGKDRAFFDQMYALDKSFSAIGQADFVINALPATELTNDLYDKPFFNAMKDSALFINIGRGQAVVEEALIHALEEDLIAGAYLDVFKKEPLPSDSPLWQTKNLLITPHFSGVVEHFRDEIFPIFEENLINFIEKKEPTKNIVRSERGY